MAVILLALALLLQTPAAPPRDGAAPAASGSFVIRGRVLDAVTGQPVQGAQVGVTPVGDRMAGGRGALTDGEGKWQVTELAAGDYTLSHSKAGYNRVRGIRIYSPVHLSAQHPVRDIELVLMRGGVITGRVLDASGEPVPGVLVSALRVMNNEAWSGSQGDTTDDRGDFRLYGLEPGEFYISASPEMGQAVEPMPGVKHSPVVTYYPGTTKTSEAERVTLSEQGELSDLTFQIQTAATFTVSGRVVSSGGSLRHAFVQMHDDEPRGVHVRGRVPGGGAMSDGRFAIAGVVPGEYVVTTRATLDDGEEVGEARVVVEDSDVEVVIQTRGPTVLSGRVVSAAGGPVPFRTMRISAFPTGPVRYPTPAGDAPIQPDGTFQVKSFGSPVRLRVFAPSDPLGWRVRDVRFRGESVIKVGLDLEGAGNAVGGVEVVIVGNTGRLRGTVKGANGTPLPDGTLVIVPEEPEPDSPITSFQAVITAGTFVSRPLAPGRYVIAAVTTTGQNAIDMELVDRVRSAGTAIELGDHETATLALTVLK